MERDGDFFKVINILVLSGVGVLRFFYKMGDVVEKIVFRMDEFDEVGSYWLIMVLFFVFVWLFYIIFLCKFFFCGFLLVLNY